MSVVEQVLASGADPFTPHFSSWIGGTDDL